MSLCSWKPIVPLVPAVQVSSAKCALAVPGVAVSSPVLGVPSESVIVVEIVESALLVGWEPWAVLAASITECRVAGIEFGPALSRPRL